jgi:ArsR family transcriptional regulator
MANQPLPKSLLERIAQRFKLLGEPSRLELLNQLMANGEMNVMELVNATGQQQANVSKHLNMMAREGILARQKKGLNVIYSIADNSIYEICELVCDQLKAEIDSQSRLLKDEQ